MYLILVLSPGSGDVIPVLLCGDMNSTPHSPLVNFITTSALDYSNLSAIVIAGYFEPSGIKRAIPKPLFPQEMCIGANCMYFGKDEKWKEDAREGLGEKMTPSDNPQSPVKQVAEQVEVQSKSGQPGAVTTSNPPAQVSTATQSKHSEFKAEDDHQSLRITQSARGRRVVAYTTYNGPVNISDVSRQLHSTGTAVKRARDHDIKSPSSGASSVYDLPMDPRGKALVDDSSPAVTNQDCQSTSSCTTEGSESSINSSTKKEDCSSSRTSSKDMLADYGSNSRGSKNKQKPQDITAGKCDGKDSSCLSHPFKLTSAYPHPSLSMPSTVTTYHQRAFETVDYIFFSPMAYSSKKQLTGFHLVQRQVLPSTHTLLDLGPQPHKYLSSDHLLLKATFQFTW